MAANQRSLQLTDRFSRQLTATAQRVHTLAQARWNLAPENFDGSYSTWLDLVVPMVTQAQKQNQRLTTAYLSAFIMSETGKRARLSPVADVSGTSRDGRPLREAWTSPPIKAKVAIMDGKTPGQASDEAKAAALGSVNLDTYHGARGPLAAMLVASRTSVGYTRVTGGNACGACLGAADGTVFGTDEVFEIHTNCDCVAEPVIEDVPNTVQRQTGDQIFNDLSLAEQNARLGEKAADAVRSGEVTLNDLIGRSPMTNEPDFITQKPLAALL